MTKKQHIIFSFMLISLFFSCNETRNADDYSDEEYAILKAELNLPQIVHNYQLQLGEHLLDQDGIFPELNPIPLVEQQKANNKATLGRVLFYDKNLSKDRNVSCGTCHQAANAFADAGQFSEGVDGNITSRNSLALATTLSFKISYNPLNNNLPKTKFSWDDAASNLKEQIHRAFANENEMDISPEKIMERISESDYYPILFERAFDDNSITLEKATESIKEFVNSISSAGTQFDHALEKSPLFDASKDFIGFSESENKGKAIYNQNCASCHSSKHNFTVKTRANNGLELDYTDKGIGGRLNISELEGMFKVPFLRNVALTAPYMHDGRFQTLEEVVDHYSENIVAHKNLDPLLKNDDGSVKKLGLSQEDKTALVDYLHTLTDYDLLHDERFSDPFIQ